MPEQRTATLTRMVLTDHECPYGVRARELLERAGFAIDEQILATRDEVDAYKAEHGVNTTPQTFIDGTRIGGSAALERYLADASPDA